MYFIFSGTLARCWHPFKHWVYRLTFHYKTAWFPVQKWRHAFFNGDLYIVVFQSQIPTVTVKYNICSCCQSFSVCVFWLSVSSGLCLKSHSLPLLKSVWILRVAKSMFISSVNHSTFWRPRQQALLLRDCEETSPTHPQHDLSPNTHTHTQTRTPLSSVRAWPSSKLPVSSVQISWY